MYENVCLDDLLVGQLKHKCFICNALICLNKKKKKKKTKQKVFKLSPYIFLSDFPFIFSCFMFNWLNEENKRFTNYLFLFFF
jgi:hypothetical protein